jgi:hypothetical protein
MTRWDDDDDEPDDDEDDDWEPDDGDTLSAAERPDPSGTDPSSDDHDAVPCPFCGRSVYEFADVCPGCGNFIGGADDPTPHRSWWMIAGLLLCLIGTIAACFHRMW